MVITRMLQIRSRFVISVLALFAGILVFALVVGPRPSARAAAPLPGRTTLSAAPEFVISAPVTPGERGLQGVQGSREVQGAVSGRAQLPAPPGQILYDQTDNPGTNAVTSQNFEPQYDAYDAQAADDFEVPAGETWTVDTIEVAGRYDRGTGPADSVNVFVYTDAGSLPAAPVFTQTDILYSPGSNAGDFIIPLDTPVTLHEGRYWLSVQANLDYTTGGQWFWRERWTRSFSEAAWRNPGGGFQTPGSCLDWGARASTCFREIPAPQRDQVFRLSGISGATPTPTNTVTGTPPTNSPTRTPRAATPTLTGTVMIPPPVGTPQPPIQPTETQTPTRTPTYTPTPVPACGLFWRIVPSANAAAPDTALAAVSASAPDDVWAVGYYSLGQWKRTFIEHWDGAQWNVIPSPNANAYDNQLYGVAAVAQNDAWAVGDYWRPDAGIGSALIFHWNGIAWSIVPNPVESQSSTLHSVSVIPSSGAWAVGSLNAQSLTLRLAGTQWVVVPSPDVDNAQNFLESVSASADNSAVAVGNYEDQVHDTYGYITMRWDGTQWGMIGQGFMSWLYSVTSVSANEAWAAGYDYFASGFAPVIMKWDGSSWTNFPTGLTNGIYKLSAISAAASNDVWAAGYYTDLGGSLYDYPLTIHCDGSQCAQVQSPNLGESSSRLLAMDALSAGDIWSAGHSIDTLGFGTTMVQRYYDPCAPPTNTPTAPPATSTPTISATAAATLTPQASATSTPTSTAASTATVAATFTLAPTITPCSTSFADVQPSDYFYQAVQYLYCVGAISGYSDGTFRPYNNTTRGQLAKIIVLAERWDVYAPPTPTFQDVPAGSPFYVYVETAYQRAIISGYSCGTGCLEFRPGNNVTRGQLAKIIVLAERWSVTPPSQPTFQDVPVSNPFYGYIETAYAHGVISGYSCGTGCLEFRPGNNATRGQISKIVYNAVTLP